MESNSSNSFLCSGYFEEFPCNTNFFKDFIIDDCICLDPIKDNAKSILSIKSNVTIENTSLCKNLIDFKCYPHIKKAHLLRVLIKMTFQIKYIGGCDGKSVFVKTSSFIKNIYLSIPININDISVKDLYRKNKITPNVFVEDLKTNALSKDSVKFSLVGFVDACFHLPNN